jgi:hypothetical protein
MIMNVFCKHSLWKGKKKLVDTGSAVSLVKKSILQDENKSEPSVIDLHGVNGDSMTIHGKLQDILCGLSITWYAIDYLPEGLGALVGCGYLMQNKV